MRSRHSIGIVLVTGAVALSASRGPSLSRSIGRVILVHQDGLVQSVDAQTGAIISELRLLTPQTTPQVTAAVVSKSGREDFVAITNWRAGTTRIVGVNNRDSTVREVAFVSDSITYPFLEAGPRTGLLYLVAEHQTHFVVIDPTEGKERGRYAFARNDGCEWPVFWAHISPDERRLYISYHGPCSSGADWIQLSDPPRVCDRAAAEREHFACVGAHGDVVPFRGGLVVADGREVVVTDSQGVSTVHDLGPLGHLMDFALDTASARVYGIGSCLYTGGLTVTDLSKFAQPSNVLAAGVSICGSLIVLSPDRSTLFVVRDAPPNSVSMIDLESGALRARITNNDLVVAVLFVDH